MGATKPPLCPALPALQLRSYLFPYCFDVVANIDAAKLTFLCTVSPSVALEGGGRQRMYVDQDAP